MDKICYTVGDIAEILGESTSLVRFWSDTFGEFIKPKRNKKGNRLFSPADVEYFKKIHLFTKERGLSLEGTRSMLMHNSEGLDQRFEVVEKLKEIKALLNEVKAEI